jgi:nucleoside-diphosphate-sugar epimerase
MKVLIIGGTGFIGSHVAEQAPAAGHEVVMFNRAITEPLSPYDAVKGDLKDLAALRDELLALKPDVVVHTIATTEQHAKDLVSVFEGTKTHLVVLGSVDCYEAFQRYSRGEDATDYPIREDAELSRKQHYYKAAYGTDYDKNLMTGVLMDAFKQGKITPTVFRLPLVYGPRDRQYRYRHGGIIKHIVDSQPDMAMSGTEQAQLFTYAYVENVAAAIVHSFGLPQTIGQVYNLGDQDVRTHRRWADLYAEIAGHQFTYRILPPELLQPDAPFNRAGQHLIVDTSKFRKETGFSEPVSLREAIKRTYEWALQHPEALANVSTDYQTNKNLVDLYEHLVTAMNQKFRPSNHNNPSKKGPAP